MTLLTVPEAAAELRLSLRTMKDITARGDIEVVRIGRRVLIRPEAVQAFVKARLDPAVKVGGRRT